MNPTALQQIVGNGCAGLAALLYALPLQYLLLEMSRKRVDGGAVLAGAILLIPMWLLLLVALSSVTASGGFDWLRLNRGWVYALTVLATLAMAAVSFLRFELSRQPSFGDRLIGGLPLHLFPILTLLLVFFSLNPRLRMGVPLQAVNLTWTVVAALSLVLCGGYLGYRLVVAGGHQFAGLSHRLSWSSKVAQEHLAQVATLDPQRDFSELVRFTNEFESRTVRDAAIARMRLHPDFVARLSVELTTGNAEHALATVDYATLNLEEQKLLAEPSQKAMERITAETRREFRYIAKDRRKAMRRWGSSLFQAIGKKLSSTGVNFQPAIHAFEQTFDNPSTTAE